MGNEIKYFNDISQQKLNCKVNSNEPKSILNNNSINIFNNFNNSAIENQKQTLENNNINLGPSNLSNINKLADINNIDNGKLNNNLLNLSFFPYSVLNENKEILKKLDNENNSISIEKSNMNELTNMGKINENSKKIDNIPKAENLTNTKNSLININPNPNIGLINDFNFPMPRILYPGLNQLALFSTLNNNLLLYPNPINNHFGNLINFNPPTQFNLSDNNNILIGKKRI